MKIANAVTAKKHQSDKPPVHRDVQRAEGLDAFPTNQRSRIPDNLTQTNGTMTDPVASSPASSSVTPIRRTRLADLENEIATLCVELQAEAEQHDVELAQALDGFERRLTALEGHSRSASTTVDIQHD
jgi:hypothetical protein